MGFIASEVALDVVRDVKSVVETIAKNDRSLADQTRRASASILLNLEEGNGRRGADRLRLFRIAEGSARELRAALVIATTWEYVVEPKQLMSHLDRLCGPLFGLTNTRPSRKAKT